MVRSLSNTVGGFVNIDINESSKYIQKYLDEHTGRVDPYFERKDGKIYDLVNKLYSTIYLSGSYEYNISQLYSYAGRFYRAIAGCPVHDEVFKAGFIKRGYLKGKSELKIAAWICVHSCILNAFLSKDQIKRLIPKDTKLIGDWNKYVSRMTDVPMYIAGEFILDNNCRCLYYDNKKVVNTNINDIDSRDVKDIHKENQELIKDLEKQFSDLGFSSKSDDHPKDDAPFDQSTIIKNADVIDIKTKKPVKAETISPQKVSSDKPMEKEIKANIFDDISPKKDIVEEDLVKSSVNTSVDSPEKDEYLEKMAKEESKKRKEPKPEDKTIIPVGDVKVESEAEKLKKKKREEVKEKKEHEKKSDVRFQKKKEYTFGQLRDAVKFADPSKTAAGKAPSVKAGKDQINQINSMSSIVGSIPDTPVVDESNPNDPYSANNRMWEMAFPGLDAFTKLIHKAGFYVQYMRSDKFPEFIYVEIIDFTMNNGMGGVKKIFFVDPGLVYGDTMRLVTTDRSDCYILGEIYLSKSQSDMIIKAIQTGLTKEDRKNINSSLPRFLHSVLYYVDMRGLQGKMKNFLVWRSFMTNLTNVVRCTPECRFRLLEVDSKDKFKLICDKQVKSVTYLDIYSNPEHVRESAKGLIIDYDPEKYGDKVYGMYHIDGTPLDFDPYKKKEDEKK